MFYESAFYVWALDLFNHYDKILLDSQNIIARLKSCTWNKLAIMSKLQRICSVIGVRICVQWIC